MTILSVNVNKIALLRNSRGRNFPDVLYFVRRLIGLGVKGITVHPRQDERHITRKDVVEITALLSDFPSVEFNIEGYPSPEFMELIARVKPAQCTLVPDAPDQLTSDHGWNIAANTELLRDVLARLRALGVRSSLFLDPDPQAVELVPDVGADRIELYTEAYAGAFGTAREAEVFEEYRATAQRARELGIGLNAGHDLDLRNLGLFLQIPGILEVSIGHALVVESLELGIDNVVREYLAITGG
ncbi:MAG: pyridoxine 5'-phosphate synthase [Gammaproteobacteria bacterium]|nr:pyridoxine 5'-phosphate synthase [Gammaproteobacteria bacterium]MDP2142387.1 pyridoxine 5'-phosphate synthase [Gammaproteobacteria bacterium]MDP2348628.1 pyridoxine 5'-phosphate synthase [Gammaproteobacteria bacterium]